MYKLIFFPKDLLIFKLDTRQVLKVKFNLLS